jgi:hypothetical protein
MVNLTTYNIAIVAFTALGGYTYAYAYAIFATTIGQAGFYKYFNLDRESETNILIQKFRPLLITVLL